MNPANSTTGHRLLQTQPVAKSGQKGLPPDVAQEKPAGERAILSGRIVDETGAPVTDAVIELMNNVNFQSLGSAKTNEDGRYEFKDVKLKQAGNYLLGIVSQRWVGIAMPQPLPSVKLEPDSKVVNDLELKRACRLRIHVVNEEDQPVKNGTRSYCFLVRLSRCKCGYRHISTDESRGWRPSAALTLST